MSPHHVRVDVVERLRDRPALHRAAAVAFAVGAHQQQGLVDDPRPLRRPPQANVERKHLLDVADLAHLQARGRDRGGGIRFSPIRARPIRRGNLRRAVRHVHGHAVAGDLAQAPRLADQLQRTAALRQPLLDAGGELVAEDPAVEDVVAPAVLVLERDEQRARLRRARQRLMSQVRAHGIRHGISLTRWRVSRSRPPSGNRFTTLCTPAAATWGFTGWANCQSNQAYLRSDA